MTREYVWYASYGSNLLKERFVCYIKGGECGYNGVAYEGCADKSEPLEDRPIIVPHRMYFAQRSRTWEYGGVSFISPYQDSSEKTLGRMYLITEEQFEDIHRQEGNSAEWYDHIIELGEADGYKILTITNSRILETTRPIEAYLQVIEDGLKETYPDMSKQEINQYLLECLNRPLC